MFDAYALVQAQDALKLSDNRTRSFSRGTKGCRKFAVAPRTSARASSGTCFPTVGTLMANPTTPNCGMA